MAENLDPHAQGPEGYVQCEITGAWLPEDETIVFQGQRVGAEGKQLLLDQLRSGEGSGEMVKPTILRRFGCLIVDGLIMGLVMALFSGIAAGAGAMMGAGLEESEATKISMTLSQAASLVGSVLLMIYYTYFHGVKGQTPGKMVGRLFVVNPDGSAINVKKAFWRAVFYNGPSLLLAIILLLSIVLVPMEAFLIVTVAGSSIISLYGLADIIVALVDTKQQRSLHDFLAKTRVVHVDKG